MSLLRWKRPLAAVLAFCGAAAGIGFLKIWKDVWRQANRDEAAPADLIVVLGAAEYAGRPSPVLRARLDHALELYRHGLAPSILTTGGAGGDPQFTEGEVGRAYLAKNDVPSESILVENRGATTVESATAAAEIMDQRGLRSCIVVSDGYHIYRVKKILEARGIRALGSPRSPGSDAPAVRGWRYARQALGYMLWKIGIRV